MTAQIVQSTSKETDLDRAKEYATLSLELARAIVREQRFQKWIRQNRQTILTAQRDFIKKCSI